MKTKRLLLSLVTMLVTFTAWADSTIRLHVPYPLYNTKGNVIESGVKVPSDNKTDWANGDMIFMVLDGGDANKAFKATYDGANWNFEEWYQNGGTPDFKPEGGIISFAMIGDDLDLSKDQPSNYAPSKTAARILTNYTGAGKKVGDIMFTNAGTYTFDEKGVVDIYLQLERPMAKIHIMGAYIGATQIRNHIEGTMPGGVDNAAGTNANYNKSKSMTLNEVNRFFPNTQTFRDKLSGSNLNGAGNMVYSARPEDAQIIDAVYYGIMEPDENGDMTIVMCSNARLYPGVQGNEAQGKDGQVAYWRTFPQMSINPNDDIYIYGPMSNEEAHLWHQQAKYAQMDFTTPELTLVENTQNILRSYCKWKAPAPSDRTLTFEVSDPSIVTVSDDGNILYTHSIGTATITATTIDGYSSTMTVKVKEAAEVVDATKSKWGTIVSPCNVKWEFFNNTSADFVVTRVAVIIEGKEADYEEGLNVLAKADNGIASGTLNVKEEHVSKLSSSILRITYTYNGKEFSVDVPYFYQVVINEANFPDENFRNYLLNTSYGRDEILSEKNVANVNNINVSGRNIKSLQGIEFFTALTFLSCYQNQIKGAEMDALIASLPVVSARMMYVIYNENEGNVITAAQVTAAKNKGWIPLLYVDSQWKEYAGRVRGDVNDDGRVDMCDATSVTNIILGTEDATEAADVNNDGEVGTPDAMFIVNRILGGKFPDEPQIVDLLEKDDYSIFLEAMKRTGLSNTILSYKNDKRYYLNNPTDAPAHGFNTLYYPSSRDYGWTVFAEKDDIFRENGINNFEDLAVKCAEWYASPSWYDYVKEQGINISTGTDYENEWNVVHMFVAYHILKAKLPVNKLVYERLAGNENWNVSFGYEPQSYYETLLPGTLLKVWATDVDDSHLNPNLWVNRYVKNNTLTDQYGTFGSDAMHPVIYSGAHIDRASSLGTENCYVHSVDKVILYDKNAVNSQHERMRFSQNMLLPELANNGIYGASPSEISAKNYYGNGYRVAFPLDYFNNLHCYNENMVLRYCVQGAWRAYESTQLQGWWAYDYAIKLPPVPTGTYELRTFYPPMYRGGEIEFYIGNDSTQGSMTKLSTLDARLNPMTEPSIGWTLSTDEEDFGVASDKIMHQNGYMRGPASFSRGTLNTITEKLVYDSSDPYSAARKMTGGTSVRTEQGYGTMMLRYIVGTVELKQGQENWLRIKNLVTDDLDLGWSLNFIELVPVDVANNKTYMEDWY